MDSLTPLLELTAIDRMRVFREDDAALAELAQVVHVKAIGGDNAAGHLDLRIRERRAAMWGYDCPIRFDMVQVNESNRPKSFDMIRAAINRVAENRTPAQRAVLEILTRLGPEKALELLRSGTSDCTFGLPAPKKD